MNKSSILITITFLLGILPACTNNAPAPTDKSDTNKIATIVAATLSAIPSATSVPSPTNVPVLTLTPDSIRPSVQLDRSDFPSVVQWVSFSIGQNQPVMISDVIGQNGAQFWRYATGGVFLGHNNAEIIVTELKKGLINSSPQCLGYNPDFGTEPDKAIIVFKDINFDWSNLGFGENKSGIVGFQFFRMEQGWELVYITPIPVESWPGLKDTLTECP
ncbi:MAG: hypothetical protein IMZ61_05130 [Planctomycetes bacterium]|nr:hypothetical protein [Planctomycetota bacterium]